MTRGYWLLAYWVGFAALLLNGGRSPGYIPYPHTDTPPYPWMDVGVELLLMTLFVAWMGRQLYAASPSRSVQWVERCLFIAPLLIVSPTIIITHASGDKYVVALFAIVTLLVFGIRLLVLRVPR